MGNGFYAQLNEIQDYSGQVYATAADLNMIGDYIGIQCTDTAGFTGILNAFEQPMTSLGQKHSRILGDWYARLSNTSAGLDEVVNRYAAADGRGKDRFDSIEGKATSGSHLPSEPPVCTARKSPEDFLKPPDMPKDSAVFKVQDLGSILPTIDWVIQKLTGGWSLLENIFKPITGNWEKLRMHADAWANTAKALDAVAQNLHDGLKALDPHWEGEAADAFHHHMGLWQKGLREEADIANSAKEQLENVAQQSETIFNELSGLLGMIVDRAATYWIPILGQAKAVLEADKILNMISRAQDLVGRLQTITNLANELIGKILAAGDVNFAPETRIPDQGFEAPKDGPR